MTPIHKYDTFEKRFLAGIVDSIVFVPFILAENYFEDRNHTNGFLTATILFNVCWMIYSTVDHGKYGQTVGKKMMGLKVFRLNERDVIGYKRAFYREAIPFAASMIILVLILVSGRDVLSDEANPDDTIYLGYVDLFSLLWFILELVTMMFNRKRRALHDLIAGSVVVNLNELKREQLQAQHKEILPAV
jgi:uncharacterized RDD family membrane protein YckC